MNTPDHARQKARRRGVWAERVAAGWLQLMGYRILARDYRSPLGEIDIIARRGDTLVFTEVKYRARRGDAAEAIDAHKQHRLHRGALAWLAAHPDHNELSMRFDAMLVTPWRPPVHVKNAWRP